MNLEDLPADSNAARVVEETTAELTRMLPGIEGQLSDDLNQQLQDLLADMQHDQNGENSRRIGREVGALLRQAEQLELELNLAQKQRDLGGIRSAAPVEDPAGFDRRAADYFRRLSESISAGS